jgi:hypothetical protein
MLFSFKHAREAAPIHARPASADVLSVRQLSLARRWRIALVGLAAVAAVAISSAPASAQVVPATATHGGIGFVPAFGYAKAHNFDCSGGTSTCALLTYHAGGPVQHGQKLYSIFWVPSGYYMPASYKAAINQYINDFVTLDYGPGTDYSVAQQYSDTSGPGGAKRFVPYALSLGGTFTDTAAYPSNGCSDSQNSKATKVCLTQSQMASQISSFVAAHSLPKGQNVQYLLFTPFNVGSCFDGTSTSCAYTQYCAYHSYIGSTTSPTTQIIWANQPWEFRENGCDLEYMGYGAGYASGSAVDPEVSTLSHEIIETMTDVNLNAWYDASGSEIGDKCAYNYNGSATATFTGVPNNGLGYYNQTANGDQYLMQDQFSNRNSNGSTTGCVSKDTDTQPVVSISPATATHGLSQTYTATVTDPAGLAYIVWNFGDGTASVTTTTATTTHTYATAGTKTLTAIVTDKHGNEKKVLKTITVS